MSIVIMGIFDKATSLSEAYYGKEEDNKSLSDKYFGVQPKEEAREIRTITTPSGHYVCQECTLVGREPVQTQHVPIPVPVSYVATGQAPTGMESWKISPEQQAKIGKAFEPIIRPMVAKAKEIVTLKPEQQEHLKQIIKERAEKAKVWAGEESKKFQEWLREKLHREDKAKQLEQSRERAESKLKEAVAM